MRWTRLAILPAAAVLASCSGDPTSPANQLLVDYILNYCSTPPAFIAIQAQSGGAWTPVTLDGTGKATVQLGDKFGLAVVRQSGATSWSTYIYYVTKAELGSNTAACATTPTTKTVNGTTNALSTGQEYQITMDGRNSYLFPGTSTFQLTGVRDMSRDVFGQRRVSNTAIADKFIMRRGQNPAAGSTMTVLDFAGSEAVTPASATATIGGVGAAELKELAVTLYTVGGLSAYFNSPPTSATSGTFYGIPAASGLSTDRHVVSLTVHNSDYSAMHGVDVFQTAIANLTITSGGVLSTPTVTVPSTSPKRLRLQLTSQADYNKLVDFYYWTSSGGVFRDMEVFVSANYLGGTPATWDVEPPVLTAVTGYPTAADMPNSSAMWSVNVVGNTSWYWANTSDLADGTVIKWAWQQSSVAAIMAPALMAGDPRQSQGPQAGARRFREGLGMSSR